MVYDCFPFFNEIDILKMRLEIMDPFVDFFLLEEADVTFSGEPKEMIFWKNREKFAKWKDKIIYVPVTDCPKNLESHEMDRYQKNQIIGALKECKPDDVILFSDVDEIPDMETVQKLIGELKEDKIYHLAQRMFYCFLNMEEVSGELLASAGEFPGVEGSDRKWLGTKVFLYQALKNRGFFELRERPALLEDGVRVENGGWHFGYMGGEKETNLSKRVSVKVQAAAHQEYNEKEILVQIADRIRTGQDIFGRSAKFERVAIDDTYPQYLREHITEYEHLIMPYISTMKICYLKFEMKIKRILRKIGRGLKRILG